MVRTPSAPWGVGGWPTSYLIDAEGIVRRRWVGQQPYETLVEAVAPLVEQNATTKPDP
ncbi:MAG TPA: hypothetical protein VGG30_11665 [Pirellulales bacterium]|jgi:hypothetical protein